jgi:SPP1 family predicted phage head-tail adaptor
MSAGELRETVKLQTKSVSRDAYGGETVTWVDTATMAAKVRPVSMREYLSAHAEQVDLKLEVTVRFRHGITASQRIYFNGAGYPIVSIVPDVKRVYATILCSGAAQVT